MSKSIVFHLLEINRNVRKLDLLQIEQAFHSDFILACDSLEMCTVYNIKKLTTNWPNIKKNTKKKRQTFYFTFRLGIIKILAQFVSIHYESK